MASVSLILLGLPNLGNRANGLLVDLVIAAKNSGIASCFSLAG